MTAGERRDPMDELSDHFDEITKPNHGRYSSRQCTECGRRTLRRIRRPWYLRLLKRVGLDYGVYRCASCQAEMRFRRS